MDAEMMHDNNGEWLSADDVFVDFGERVRRGYDPERVDSHLEAVASGIKALRSQIDSGPVDDEALDLMMRAGRRSIDEALEEARVRAEVILADAERDAEQRLADVDSKVEEILTTTEEEAREHQATVEIRGIEIAALDGEIETRQSALRTAAAELLQLADGMSDATTIDLRESDAAGSTDAGESVTT